MVVIAHKNTAEVDTTTLAAGLAISIGNITPTGGLVRNFMLKNLETHMHVSIPNLGDSFVVVLGDIDASPAEIAEAFATTEMDYEDSVEYRQGQDEVRRIWSIMSIPYNGLVAGGSVQMMHSWKLPPKGIPLLKGRGLTLFCVNTDTAAAFSNGPSFKPFSKLMGGWF